jgi:aryl-alcohol dehydrogenase-like predicted oxidoreductase
MQQRSMGRTGLKVSAIGLGGNTFGATVRGDEAVAVIHRALDCGITFIDTADIYSRGTSEEIVGQAVAGRRHDVIVGTKLRHPMSDHPNHAGLSRRWIMQAAEDSLRRLNTDYIDLYQVHAPDWETPLEETLRALDDLVHQGKVRYIGCSNFTAWLMVHGLGISDRYGLARWASVQNRWNLLEGLDDAHVLDAAGRLGVGIIPYTPLASGALTGKYQPGVPPPPGTRAADNPNVGRRITDARLRQVERLQPWAQERGHGTGDLAIAWLLSHPEVATVIVGARTPEQVEENVKAAEWSITAAEREEVAALVNG